MASQRNRSFSVHCWGCETEPAAGVPATGFSFEKKLANIVRFFTGAGGPAGSGCAGHGCFGIEAQFKSVAGTSRRGASAGISRGRAVQAVNNSKGSVRNRAIFSFINITY